MGRRKLTTKGHRDKVRAKQRLAAIKHLSTQPVIKKVNVEDIIATFNKKESPTTPNATSIATKEATVATPTSNKKPAPPQQKKATAYTPKATTHATTPSDKPKKSAAQKKKSPLPKQKGGS